MRDNKIAQSVEVLGNGAVDTASDVCKHGMKAVGSAIDGAFKTIDNALNVGSAAIDDTFGLVKSLRGIGIDTTKKVVGETYDTLKTVGREAKDGVKTAYNEAKSFLPEPKAAPAQNLTPSQVIAKAREDAKRLSQEADDAEKRLNRPTNIPE